MKTAYVFKVLQTEHGLVVLDKAEAKVDTAEQFYMGIIALLETLSATGDFETIKREYEAIDGDIAIIFNMESATSENCQVYFVPADTFVTEAL